jgi:hypothetical protein
VRDPDEPFRCFALGCELRPRVCVRRQIEAQQTPSAMSRTPPRNPNAPWSSSHAKRGVGPEFVHCLRCPQGRAIREQVGDECARQVRHGGRRDVAVQVPRFIAWLQTLGPGE